MLCTANKLASVPRSDNLKGAIPFTRSFTFTHSFSWCHVHRREYWKEDKRRMYLSQDQRPIPTPRKWNMGEFQGLAKKTQWSQITCSYTTFHFRIFNTKDILPKYLSRTTVNWSQALVFPEAAGCLNSFVRLFLEVGWEEDEVLPRKTEEHLQIF